MRFQILIVGDVPVMQNKVVIVEPKIYQGTVNKLSIEKRLVLLVFATCLYCLTVVGSVVASEVSIDENKSYIPARPFSGVLVEFNRNNLNAKRETRLLLSEHGIRSETQTNWFGKEKIIFIKNYQTGQEWLADPGRRTFSEIPKGSQIESSKEATNDQPYLIGVLTNKPCVGANGSKQSTRIVGKNELSIWRCSDERGRTYLQHYSTLLGVVVRQETQDGWISELRDITLVENSLDHFKPSNDYYEVSLSGLITRKTELAEYVE